MLVGTIDSDGTNGQALAILLTGDANSLVVSALLDALQYQDTSQTPSGFRDIEVFLSDGDGGLSEIATTRLSIDGAGANLAPVLSGLATVVTFTPAAVTAPQLLDSNVTLTDNDSNDFATGFLTISYDSADGRSTGLPTDQLSFNANVVTINGSDVEIGGVKNGELPSGGANGANLIVGNFTAAATAATVEQLIEAVQFQSTANPVPEGARSLTITVDDGDGGV